jgi:hypothetical protein
MEPPLQAEGSGSFMIALYNIQNGCNVGLNSALQAMKLMGVDCGVFLETKLTKGVYTHWSSSNNIHSTHAPSKWQGGISLFWRASETYEIEEVEMRGLNVLSFQLVLGATRWYIVGCYIPPNDLTTITHVKQAWQAYPRGYLPIFLGDLNINLAAPRDERNETIAKQVDTMVLVDMSSHFCQCSMLREKFRGEMDMVDEEGETVGLYSMQLRPREGNQPGAMVLARQPECHFVTIPIIALLLPKFAQGGGGRWQSTGSGIGVSPSRSPGDPVQSSRASMRSYVST